MQGLAEIVRSAAARQEVRAAVAELYRRVQAEADRRRPVCQVSGRCCHFEAYGHRLYVTTIELAAFAGELRDAQHAGRADGPRWDGAGCPFQVAKLCSVHPFRPFGCRMYFCDATSTQWQNEAYERFHGELKRMHETLGVPYAYVEWRQALGVLGIATGTADGASQARSLNGGRTSLPLLNPEP